MINNAKKYLDYYCMEGYCNPSRGKNGRDEGQLIPIIRGGRTARGLRARRFFASAPCPTEYYFGGLHGGSSDPPAHVSGINCPCSPSFFGASYWTAP